MNLINKKFLKKGNVIIERDNGTVVLDNDNDSHSLIVFPHVFKNKKEDLILHFKGELYSGDAPTLKLLDRRKNIISQFDFNTISTLNIELTKYYIVVLYVPPKSKFKITELDIKHDIQNTIDEFAKRLTGDILVITPGYPSMTDKYDTAFVHTKVKNYIKAGLNVDVISSNALLGASKYEFDGVKVIRCHYSYLREILAKKKYKKILIHFFDYRYGNILDSVDITETELYFYMHGADCLYRDSLKFAGDYFTNIDNAYLNDSDFKIRDYYLKKYNKNKNVKWIFVSDFVRKRAEQLNDIKFSNYEIIPCYIDQTYFNYQKKNPDLRKKIFVLRKFSNDRCYAIDIDVRTILELSKRKIFADLEFDIYGSGELFEQLTNPIKKFDNVHIHNGFLTHEEIKKVHDEHGIALFASRFDTQGVSLGEAILSGCVPISSKIETISNYIDSKYNVLCDVENFVEYADVIERIYKNKEEFEYLSKSLSNDIEKIFSYKNTIQKEIDLLKKDNLIKFKIDKIEKHPVLTIVVPAYNVEKYIWNGISSLINQRNVGKLEIIIVDDGSKDRTKQISQKLVEKTTIGKNSVVKLIAKKNGGHGSTINEGIKAATGKYLKIMDGDDTLDSYKLAELIDILETENADIILNNYIEDFYQSNTLNYKEIYPFMVPGMEYQFEDLCYDGYGFSQWGPILSCSTYKTEMLKKLDFKLLEHCFYVDMQLNTNISIGCKTIKYYPMFLYRYLLGRTGQSVSKSSYMKNYMHHQKVTMELINILHKNIDKISDVRKEYIINKLILVMINTQYIVTIDFYNKRKPFLEFERELKKYPEFYNNPKILNNGVKFHRLTKGYFIWCNSFLVKLKRFLKSFKL